MKYLRTSVTLTTVPLDQARVRRIVRADPGKALTEKSVDALLEQHARRVKEWFGAGREFRWVKLVNGDFNFVEVKPGADEGAEGQVRG